MQRGYLERDANKKDIYNYLAYLRFQNWFKISFVYRELKKITNNTYIYRSQNDDDK